MKKILSLFTMLLISIFSITVTHAADTFELKNGHGETAVNTDTIFVGKVEKNTSIIDLFSQLSISGEEQTDYMQVLDVRFVTPEAKDFKVQSDTEIIDTGSTVYVLFKSVDDGGLVTANTPVSFTTKNLQLSQIGTVNPNEENAYNTVYEVTNNTAEEVEEVIAVEETPTDTTEPEEEVAVDEKILKENNTGTKSNLVLILFLLMGLTGLFLFQKKGV